MDQSIEIKITKVPDFPDTCIVSITESINPSLNSVVLDPKSVIKSLPKGNYRFLIIEFNFTERYPDNFLLFIQSLHTCLRNDSIQLILCGLAWELREQLYISGKCHGIKYSQEARTALYNYCTLPGQWTENITVSFPAHLSFVPPIRQMARNIALRKNFGQKDAFRIEIIVDEICNNAIEHGVATTKRPFIDMRIAIDSKKVSFSISGASDPEKLEYLKKIIEQHSMFQSIFNRFNVTRGRGVNLVRLLTTHFSIENRENETCVQMSIN